MVDAEGRHNGDSCPRCGGVATITYYYDEGFEELECPECGYSSEATELDALARYDSELVEAGARHSDARPGAGPQPDSPPYPRRSLKA